ncbi:hypothetical protein ABTX83_14495 [Streptomyces werraensis]|uniref:hypothetical protein n=1 Tax=Streptomyces werraensis TaxID=68284 RepID=UPI00332D42AB
MTRMPVAGDDPQLTRPLVIHVQTCHRGVDVAPDGATAPRLAAARRPHVVRLDLGLPAVDGHVTQPFGMDDLSNSPRVRMAPLRRRLEKGLSHPGCPITEPGMGCRYEA